MKCIRLGFAILEKELSEMEKVSLDRATLVNVKAHRDATAGRMAEVNPAHCFV